MIKKIIKFISNPKENYANAYFLKYHFYKLLRKIKNKKRDNAKNDMFNWPLYTLHYKGELKEISKIHTISLNNNDYIFSNGKFVKHNNNIKPLHPNWRLLYETILQLNPNTAFELGCGNGMHLRNIQALNPRIKLSAVDISKDQIKFLRESYPDLKAEIKQADATKLFSKNFLPKADLSFTQAVIMHIHKDDKHLMALENLFNMSKKYVIMIERWKNHNFMDDIKKLHNENKIKWDHINFYYKYSEELKKPHLMICSKEKLDYPKLTDYNILNTEKK